MTRNIALISEHASPLAGPGGVDSGGQNIYVAQVARHLARLGHHVDVFTRRDSSRLPEVVQWKDGVRIVNVKAGPAKYVRKEELLPFMDEFTDYCIRFIKSGARYDTIHANFWMSGLVAAEIKQKLSIPFAITFHALGRVRRLHQRNADDFPDARFSIEERVVADADRIIAECPQDQEDLTLLYSADAEKVAVIPCGFDPAEFWPVDRFLARRELNLPQDAFIVLQLGRLVPRKGIDTAIRGFAEFLRLHPVNAQLLVVGGESPIPNTQGDQEMARLREIAVSEKAEDKIFFLGRRGREKLRYYYSAADVFVTTPWYEPFGITPLEAMACGVPVIGADVGGIKYTVIDGETGYLVPPKDDEKIARMLSYLYTHPSARETLGREGVKRVNRHFTWQKVTGAVAEVYEEIIGRAGRRSVRREDQMKTVGRGFETMIDVLRDAQAALYHSIIDIADTIAGCVSQGGKLLVCGNGGSAAEAQHFAGELVGRFKYRHRPAMPALALTADSAVLTAWSNDVGYEHAFARQVQAFGRPGDVLLCLSTSGQSANLIRACEQAHESGLTCIALLGGKGGEMAHLADKVMLVPASDPQRVQEIHLVTLHLIAELVEEQVVASKLESAGSARTEALRGTSTGAP